MAEDPLIRQKRCNTNTAQDVRRSCTFSHNQRVLSSDRYRQIFNEGDEVVGRHLVVWISRAAQSEHRVGVVASKRTFHDAVDRNRAKRLMRESVRLLQHELVGEPWDMVILARRKILQKKQPEVQRELLKLCRWKGIVIG